MEATVRLYRASHFGGSLSPRRELGEILPFHADMLRYDLAFHSPDDVNLIIFPVFTGKNGRSSDKITTGRWESFSINLKELDPAFVTNLESWITYRHPHHSFELEPITLEEFMKNGEKTKIARTWR